MPTYRLEVNGESRSVDSRDPAQPLLYVLRNALHLTGPKFGCGLAQCGACIVLVDGKPVRSCIAAISTMEGRRVTTIEGLGTPAKPHRIQAAFIAEQAAQCGYCTNGMVMTCAALLDSNSKPTLAQAKEALNDCLCRCGSHARVLRAVMRVAEGKSA
jgi:nicotinate dehydrogenase subunit A